MLPVPLRLSILKPHLIADADEFAQRLDVERGLSEQHLHIGTGQRFWRVGGFKQAVNNIGRLVHAGLRGSAEVSA